MIKGLKQGVTRLSIKKKLILYGYMFITPMIAVVCVILLLENYDKVQEEKLNNDLVSVNALSDSIQLLQADMENFSTYICINDQVKALLTADNPKEKNENARLWYDEAPMQMIQEMMALKGDIQTMAIYPENGVRPYLRCMDGSAYVSSVKKVHKTETYKETMKSKNGMLWEFVPKGSGNTYHTNRKNKIGLYRKIYDLRQKKVIGYIVIGANQKQFKDLCESALKEKNEGVIVLDQNSGELCRAGKLDAKVEAYLKADEFMKKNYRKRDSHFTYQDYEVICKQSDSNASIICKVVPKYSKQTRMLDVAYMPISLLVGMLVGLLPVFLIISKFVTTLIKLEERESELTALQAQINPHFLYNTLDSLYWQATAADNDEIAESIMALSDLFRLVLNRGNSEVAVSHELDLISKYLQIQKMRFSKRLNYEIEVEEEIKKVKIPKLILQPFVENAVVHGLENISTPCTLKVIGKQMGDYIHFEVLDTGIGMTKEQVEAIWNTDNDSYANQRIGRYAIKNVRERLDLRYNGDFKLEIESSLGHGTKVIVEIPLSEG